MAEETFDRRIKYHSMNSKSASRLTKTKENAKKKEKYLILSLSDAERLNKIWKLGRKSPLSLLCKATWTSESDLTSPFNERYPRRCSSTDSSLLCSPNPSESDSNSIDSSFVPSSTILETIEEENENKSNI